MEQNNTALIDKLISTQEFSTLPSVTMKVLSLLEDDDSLDIRNLAKLIETDASLTLKLIRVANSPLFAISGDVTSVHQAIVTLGLNRVSNIVLGISIFSKFLYSAHKDIQSIIENYWRHTSSTGTVSKSFAKRIGVNFKEYEFIGGLLHDIGKLAMLQNDTERYRQVIELVVNEGLKDIQAERAIYGFDHTEVGAGIARQWRLPIQLSSILEFHCDFTRAPDNMKSVVAVVNLSNTLCDIWGAGFFEGNRVVRFEETPEWKHLSTISKSDLDFEQISFELETDFRESAEFLNIMSSEK
ncbi:MAG: HDOD domain-containing protein [Ignavibacteria bacterium]|jgi:putative nucleotidyltransferase with HDIG domain|nr:HDOD domain-containing protein [Ignavibacteria bacterium]